MCRVCACARLAAAGTLRVLQTANAPKHHTHAHTQAELSDALRLFQQQHDRAAAMAASLYAQHSARRSSRSAAGSRPSSAAAGARRGGGDGGTGGTGGAAAGAAAVAGNAAADEDVRAYARYLGLEPEQVAGVSRKGEVCALAPAYSSKAVRACVRKLFMMITQPYRPPPHQEADLMHIAAAAMAAPPPPRWSVHLDAGGAEYFVHLPTQAGLGFGAWGPGLRRCFMHAPSTCAPPLQSGWREARRTRRHAPPQASQYEHPLDEHWRAACRRERALRAGGADVAAGAGGGGGAA